MTDGFPDRLTQLKARWQADPSSRVFLQLAEEYRHLGRVQEALAVLDGGLREHPGYLSALVAKGRCLLELGDAEQARGVLERVVQQDPTQMVANKLLVRAHLETNEPERAGQKLDLYTLLNDSDPEIEELRKRVEAMSRPPRAVDGPPSEEPAERPRMERTEMPVENAEPFPDPAPEHSQHLYRSSFAAENLFFFGDAEPPAPVGTLAADDAEPAAAVLAEPAAAESAELAPPVPTELAAPGSVPSLATVTLGDLYFRQGHLEEAEEIFREVLHREPASAAAQEGLARIDRRRRPLEAAELLAGVDPQASPPARKAHVLQSYLTRLRQARSPNVP